MNLSMAPAKRESSDERKLAIALAARDLIVEKGLEGLRTRDIAQRVGINIATLHYHVPSKAALIELVTETMVHTFKAQSLNRPRAHLPPLERLEHEYVDFHEMFTEHRDVLAVMSELMERARRDDTIRAIILPVLAKWRDVVANIFQAGIADGTFRADLDPQAAAHIQIGALIAFCRGPDLSRPYFDRLCAELSRSVFNPFPPKD